MKHSRVLVTGANRGIGRALIENLLARGVERVFASARSAKALEELVALDRVRVSPLIVDITDPAQVQAAAHAASGTTLLLNNAGVLASFGLLDSSLEHLRRDVETNYFGLLNVVRSFVPVLERSGGGAIANVLSVASLASMPALGGYSASKAAAHSLTQALRAQLRPKGIRVHAVYPGPVDTDMIRGFDLPKTKASEVARAILEGIEAENDDIFPDPMSRDAQATWSKDPRALEQRFGAM